MPSKKLVIAVIVIVVVGALGGLAYRIYLNPAHDNAIDLVPSDAFFYASVFLDPSTHQKQALGELLRHFPEAKTPSLAKGELENLLNDALASTGVDFTHDVEPWIGRQVAFFADGIEGDSADVAFLVGTSDVDAARATLAKAATHSSDSAASHESYRGNDFTVVGGKARGIVGNFVVLASDANVFEKVVRTQQGRSLGDSTDYERAVSVLPRDRIATAYLDTVRSLESAARSAGGSASQLAALGPLTTLAPIAVGVFLRGDGIVVDGAIHRSGPVSISRGPGLLARLPADTRAALSVPQVGPGLSDLFSAPSSSTAHLALGALLKARTGLDLDSDLLSWMGDVAFFVTDIAHLRGGAVVESSAPATSRRVVEQIGESLLSRGLDVTLTPRTPQQSAFKVRSRHLPTLHVTASKSDVQAIFGSVPLASDELHLGDEPMFERAETSLGQDYSIKGFVDARTLVSYFERGSAGSTALPATAKAAVRPLSFIGLGTRSDRDTLFARLVIGVN